MKSRMNKPLDPGVDRHPAAPSPVEPLCAWPPLHRVERQLEGDTLVMLTALRPELGWPIQWAWLKVRETLSGYVALEPARPLREQLVQVGFEMAGQAHPGEALRCRLPLEAVPPEPGTGLLCLLLYVDARGQWIAGARRAQRPDDELEAALQAALAMETTALRHAFVPRPQPDETAAREEGLSFILAACQYPPGLLDAPQGAERDPRRAGPVDAALARLVDFTRHTPEGQACSLLLIAGDEIYADASGGLADAHNSVERYSRAYSQFKAGLVRHLPPTLARIVHAPDDHEIEDNWGPVRRADGREDGGPWIDPARAAAWAARWEPGEREGLHRHFWHRFDWRGVRFFIADTRTERQPRPQSRLLTARIMGQAQWLALQDWLGQPDDRPRVVLSGSLLLPRRRSVAEYPGAAAASDAFDGFPASQHDLLRALWTQGANDVVFLSGDEHRSGHATAWVGVDDGQGGLRKDQPVIRLLSLHSSALYAPWPFSVTDQEAFQVPDSFALMPAGDAAASAGPPLRCLVTAWADHPGDGFAVVRMRAGQVEVAFNRAEGGTSFARWDTAPR